MIMYLLEVRLSETNQNLINEQCFSGGIDLNT